MACEVCLLGNHDQGALFDPEGFNSGAERAIFWTRSQLENGPEVRPSGSDAGTSSASCRATTRTARCCSFTARRNPLERIRLSRRHLQSSQAGENLRPDPALCLPGPYPRAGRVHRSFQFYSPEELNYQYRLGRRKGDDQRRLGRPTARRQSSGVLRRPGRQSGAVPPRRISFGTRRSRRSTIFPELDNFLGDRSATVVRPAATFLRPIPERITLHATLRRFRYVYPLHRPVASPSWRGISSGVAVASAPARPVAKSPTGKTRTKTGPRQGRPSSRPIRTARPRSRPPSEGRAGDEAGREAAEQGRSQPPGRRAPPHGSRSARPTMQVPTACWSPWATAARPWRGSN